MRLPRFSALLGALAAVALGTSVFGGTLQAGASTMAVPVACVAGPTAAPSPTRPRYDVEIDLNVPHGRLRGRSVITFTPDLATPEVVLRLWPNGGVREALSSRITVEAVEVGGRAAAVARPDPTTLVVRLERALEPGQQVVVSVVWTLIVPGSRDDRISRTGTSMRLGSFMPVLAWEDGVGWNRTPATIGKAESSMTTTADWLVTVHPTLGVDILGTGVDDGNFTWTATAMRDWAMSVGNFTRASATVDSGGRSVQVVVGVHRKPGSVASEDPARYLARVTAALKRFGALYGPYPWSSYSLAITPDLRGGIEYPAHVMQGPGSIGRTTPHEVAHMWFYGLVGNDQGRDPWIDEGLASWAEARAEGTLASFRSKAIPADGVRLLGRPMSYWDRHQSAYYRSIYVQTVQVLARLGAPERVDCALRRLVAQSAYGVVRPNDVLRALTTEFPEAGTLLRNYGIAVDVP